MAAGQGFKTFVTGEVLTAGDVNGYLMQGINVFTNATARDAAITAPAEGQFAFTKDNNSLWYYDGAAWVASGATGDIEGVTAGVGISGGGTSGTVTITNSMATAIDAKGDLVAGTGADTFSRIAVGANDTVLTADSTTATGLKWAAASGGGMTLIASGTLSGATTTISSIPTTYNNLQLLILGARPSSSGFTTYIYPNGPFNGASGFFNAFTSAFQSGVKSNMELNPVGAYDTTVASSAHVIIFYDYARATANRIATMNGRYFNTANWVPYNATHVMDGTSAAITSLAIASSSSWSAGNYYLYGVK